ALPKSVRRASRLRSIRIDGTTAKAASLLGLGDVEGLGEVFAAVAVLSASSATAIVKIPALLCRAGLPVWRTKLLAVGTTHLCPDTQTLLNPRASRRGGR